MDVLFTFDGLATYLHLTPDDSSKLMGVATFALVVSFGTAAAPGAATYSVGETTLWEIREGSKTLQLLVSLVVPTPPPPPAAAPAAPTTFAAGSSSTSRQQQHQQQAAPAPTPAAAPTDPPHGNFEPLDWEFVVETLTDSNYCKTILQGSLGQQDQLSTVLRKLFFPNKSNKQTQHLYFLSKSSPPKKN